MDEFKTQMRWNQEELEQWALAAKQKEEDNLALQKYTRADESKVKELNLQVSSPFSFFFSFLFPPFVCLLILFDALNAYRLV